MTTVEVIAVSYSGGTVAEGMGIDMEDGSAVRFAGDWRPMSEIGRALMEGEEPILADVPDWAILTRR